MGCGLVLIVVEGNQPFEPSVNPARAPGIFPLVTNLHGVINSTSPVALLLIVSLGASSLILLLAYLTLLQPKVAVTAVFVFFAIGSILDVVSISGTESTASAAVPFEKRLTTLSAKAKVVAYDQEAYDGFGYYGLPFWMNKSDFIPYKASNAKWPTAQAYIGPANWPAAKARGLHLFGIDPRSEQGVWVR